MKWIAAAIVIAAVVIAGTLIYLQRAEVEEHKRQECVEQTQMLCD